MPRGEGFYGRQALVAEILDGPRECLWLLGRRGIGKTSLLKHLELLTERSPERGYLPLFWDLQAATDLAELHLTFHQALREAERRLDRAGLDAADFSPDDLFASIGRLRRHLWSRRSKLLLLCDEAEGLIPLGRQDPTLLPKLRRMMQSQEGIRTVLASTIRLWALAGRKDDTSPFLHGFSPPLYLQALTNDEARWLIAQAELPAGAGPRIDDEAAATIRRRCDNHPYLLQLVCRRYLEVRDLGQALDRVATDARVASIFSSDLQALSSPERAILEALSRQASATSGQLQERLPFAASTLDGSLHRLESLGFVARNSRQRWVLRNSLFRRWLRTTERPSSSGGRGEPQPSVAARATEIVADLSRIEKRGAASPEELLDLVYAPMRNLARRYLSRERPGHTLQPTALVHEAYLKLVDQSRVDWRGRSHFFAVGARIMRRILIDYARSRRRAKRGGDRLRVTLTGLAALPLGRELDADRLLALHSALEELARTDERQARVVELRFFAGLKMVEVAAVLGVSKRTADGDWAKARAWLDRELGARGDGPGIA